MTFASGLRRVVGNQGFARLVVTDKLIVGATFEAVTER